MGESLTLPDAEATESLGRIVAGALPDDAAGFTILLEGELGAGKSALARAMLRALGHEGTVPSPTYTLVEPYQLPNYPAYHIDLYRIESSDELEFLGWQDLADGLQLIEWPERVPGLGAGADVRIALGYEGAGRSAVLEALSARGAAVLAAVRRALDKVSP